MNYFYYLTPLVRLNLIESEGLEEFEGKIDKIASGQDDDSWIGQLYNKMSKTMLSPESNDDNSNNNFDMEGLEPPIFDETWNSPYASSGGNATHHQLSEDDNKNNEVSSDIGDGPLKEVFHNVIPNLIFGSSSADEHGHKDANCQSKLFKCVSGILVNGGLQHMDEPQGVAGAFKKMMFKVAFHGGLGNFWNSLMEFPEARGIKRCFNDRDSCISHQLLAEELEKSGVDAKDASRILINPDFAQATDQSDGSEMFSPEDQKLEDELNQ